MYKKYFLNFQSIRSSFFKYSKDIYKSEKLIIRAVMRNPEMLKFVPDHLKTKKQLKHAVKKLPYLLRYIPDQYKTQKM